MFLEDMLPCSASAQIKQAIQPMTVQPSRKLSAMIAATRGVFHAMRVGRK